MSKRGQKKKSVTNKTTLRSTNSENYTISMQKRSEKISIKTN